MQFDPYPITNSLPSAASFHPMTVLIVDDEWAIREVLQKALSQAGYVCHIAESAEQALEIFRKIHVDILVTDIKMSGMDGIQLIRKIRETHDTSSIVMTGYQSRFSYEDVVGVGASDFVGKPVTPNELLVRVRRIARERRILKERNRKHEALHETFKKLRHAYHDTINRLIRASQFKDEDTGDHVMRIGRFSALLAQHSGMTNAAISNIFYAAPMHDVGKIGIPDSILLKPGKLSDEEFEIMKRHTLIGGSILQSPKSDILEMAREIALTHHEQWDGKGYPQGMGGKQIPLPGRIVKLADVFDALTSPRPYKEPYPVDVAMEIIIKERGRHFDPDLVDLFLSVQDEIFEIKRNEGGLREGERDTFLWSERDLGYLPSILKKKE